jgi:hypothetical protein
MTSQSQLPPDPQKGPRLPPRAPQNLHHPFSRSFLPPPKPRRRFVSLLSSLLFFIHLFLLFFHCIRGRLSLLQGPRPTLLSVFSDSNFSPPLRSLPPFNVELQRHPTLESTTQQLLRPALLKLPGHSTTTKPFTFASIRRDTSSTTLRISISSTGH